MRESERGRAGKAEPAARSLKDFQASSVSPAASEEWRRAWRSAAAAAGRGVGGGGGGGGGVGDGVGHRRGKMVGWRKE